VAEAPRREGKPERIRAVGATDRVRGTEVRGRLALERLDLGAEDEATRLEHFAEAFLELRDEWRVLRLDVDERNHDIRVYRDGQSFTPRCREKCSRCDRNRRMSGRTGGTPLAQE